MGWLRLVGSSKLQVSFAEYRLFYRALLQKRPVISPVCMHACIHTCMESINIYLRLRLHICRDFVGECVHSNSFACLHACLFVYLYVCCMYVCIKNGYVCQFTRVYRVNSYACMLACLYTYIYMYIYMYMYVRVCVYMYIYICIYLYIYLFIFIYMCVCVCVGSPVSAYHLSCLHRWPRVISPHSTASSSPPA